MTLRSAPDEVRDLRGSWRSQAERVPGLTWELEQDFRFGQRISKTERGYVMGGTMKGGSSSMWYPATRAQYHAYKRWRNLEGLEEGRDDAAFARLQELCARHRIALTTRRHAGGALARAQNAAGDGAGRGGRGMRRRGRREDDAPYPGFGPLYRIMHEVLAVLPERHLERASLERLHLGGWGPDAAKASAYQDGAVLMYDFACHGARRTFVGLFLHELGHAHEVDLSEAEKDAIYAGYKVLLEDDAFFGLEFLVDGDTRKLYQRFVYNEFLAETYMVYVACGARMRAAIEEMPAAPREAWRSIYAAFRASFAGIEYE